MYRAETKQAVPVTLTLFLGGGRMGKYAISRQFYPFAMFKPPIRNAKTASFMGSFLRVPGWLMRDKNLKVQQQKIPGFVYV